MNAKDTAERLLRKHGAAEARRKVGQRMRTADARLQLARMHPTRPVWEEFGAWTRITYWRQVYRALQSQEGVA
jgi:hypothetical protein